MRLEVGNHAQGMNPSISSTGPMQSYWRLGYQSQLLFQRPLNCWQRRLTLPTGIGSAIIGYNKSDIAHKNRMIDFQNSLFLRTVELIFILT